MPWKAHKSKKKSGKSKYKVKNWKAYNKALINRGDIRMYIPQNVSEVFLNQGLSVKSRGGQLKYTDTYIEFLLTLRVLFKLPFRQLQGFSKCILSMMNIEIDVPEFSRINKRISELSLTVIKRIKSTSLNDGITIIIDSTGLKTCGEQDWINTKYGLKQRRSWRKFHLSIDKNGCEIVDCKLTDNRVSDNLLLPYFTKDQGVKEVIADKGYHSTTVYNKLFKQSIKTTIPPPNDSLIQGKRETSINDYHVDYINQKGLLAWQNKHQYNSRSKVEYTFGRFKKIFGGKLLSKKIEIQRQELIAKCNILNRFNRMGMPVSVIV